MGTFGYGGKRAKICSSGKRRQRGGSWRRVNMGAFGLGSGRRKVEVCSSSSVEN